MRPPQPRPPPPRRVLRAPGSPTTNSAHGARHRRQHPTHAPGIPDSPRRPTTLSRPRAAGPRPATTPRRRLPTPSFSQGLRSARRRAPRRQPSPPDRRHTDPTDPDKTASVASTTRRPPASPPRRVHQARLDRRRPSPILTPPAPCHPLLAWTRRTRLDRHRSTETPAPPPAATRRRLRRRFRRGMNITITPWPRASPPVPARALSPPPRLARSNSVDPPINDNVANPPTPGSRTTHVVDARRHRLRRARAHTPQYDARLTASAGVQRSAK